MKITRKARNIKSRYIGLVDDFHKSSDHKWFVLGWNRILKYNYPEYRVYSDEIPLPEPEWCVYRSHDFLLSKEPTERMYAAATAWVRLACKIQSIKNSLKNI